MRPALCLLAFAVVGCAQPDPAPPAGGSDAALSETAASVPGPTPAVSAAGPDSTTAALERALLDEFGPDSGEIRYLSGQADLDGDGRPEVVAHVVGPLVCGSGGCNTLVFTPDGDGLRLVGDVSVNRPPVVVAETRTNGWRDLVVAVAGGGMQAGHARLPFDGTAYPGNPTVEPAEVFGGPVRGDEIIGTLDSFEDATVLRDGSNSRP